MSGTTDHLWGIILAGGEGRRLQPFIRSYLGSERPKQCCALLGTHSTLRHTIARAERLILPERLLTVVTRQHLIYAQEELDDRPPCPAIRHMENWQDVVLKREAYVGRRTSAPAREEGNDG